MAILLLLALVVFFHSQLAHLLYCHMWWSYCYLHCVVVVVVVVVCGSGGCVVVVVVCGGGGWMWWMLHVVVAVACSARGIYIYNSVCVFVYS